ncbi:hypothetical protein O181_009226 [Austropuccinia psidii MF-1]|uniref:PCI domain-containing protein n=1 Tax=Austropuccinia psidii MF-1 TaxID=1389203 RepID=A0A9Q3GJA0_9BASI|nr:hypothetical protein [Austropuccinia psidii MF-1]
MMAVLVESSVTVISTVISTVIVTVISTESSIAGLIMTPYSPFMASANIATTTQGSVWTVLVQPSFVDLVFEASVLVTKGPAHQAAPVTGIPKSSLHPSEFALRIEESAQALVGRAGTNADKDDRPEGEGIPTEDGGETKEQDTEEVKQAKQKIVAEIWSKVQPGCFTRTDDRELEAATNLLLTLLLTFFSPSHPDYSTFVLRLLEAIATAEGKTTSYGRYNPIFTLFNALPGPHSVSEDRLPLQLTIFSRLADLVALHPEDLNILLPTLLRLPSYLTQWGLVSSKAGISVITQVIRLCEQGGKPQDAFNLSLVYLSSPSLANQAQCAEIDQVVEYFLKLTLSLPDCYEWDLLDDIVPIDRYLHSNPTGKERYQNLINLLKSPSTKFQEVEKELKSNTHLHHSLSEEVQLQVQKKARLLCLTEMCASRVGGEVKYSEVKDCLGLKVPIEEDDGMEVEEWVIDAVKVKLISAKLHQPSQMISITKAVNRSFGTTQWQLLGKKLQGWSHSIDRLITVVEDGLSSIDLNRQGTGKIVTVNA